jgi:Na+/H+ antiporter NhaA
MIPKSQSYDMIREVLRLESAGGIPLVIATVFALILANSAFGGSMRVSRKRPSSSR